MSLYTTLSIVLIMECIMSLSLEIRRKWMRRKYLKACKDGHIVPFDPDQTDQEKLRLVA